MMDDAGLIYLAKKRYADAAALYADLLARDAAAPERCTWRGRLEQSCAGMRRRTIPVPRKRLVPGPRPR
ncbi:MAG: hypothetical protein H6745_31690 [Deltaproteobacteria bacterium]|nr:hypothetical protein [Deltaproteobacteria bacterium]